MSYCIQRDPKTICNSSNVHFNCLGFHRKLQTGNWARKQINFGWKLKTNNKRWMDKRFLNNIKATKNNCYMATNKIKMLKC